MHVIPVAESSDGITTKISPTLGLPPWYHAVIPCAWGVRIGDVHAESSLDFLTSRAQIITEGGSIRTLTND